MLNKHLLQQSECLGAFYFVPHFLLAHPHLKELLKLMPLSQRGCIQHPPNFLE